MELGRSKSFEDHHGAATLGTAPKWIRRLGWRRFWFGWRRLFCVELSITKRQERGAPPVGKEAKVADADEAFGQHVQQEAAQELIER